MLKSAQVWFQSGKQHSPSPDFPQSNLLLPLLPLKKVHPLQSTLPLLRHFPHHRSHRPLECPTRKPRQHPRKHQMSRIRRHRTMSPTRLTQQRFGECRCVSLESNAQDWVAGRCHFANLSVQHFNVVALTGIEFDVETPAPYFEELSSQGISCSFMT